MTPLTLSEWVALVDAGEASCEDVAAHVLERRHATEPHVHAYVSDRDDAALDDARAADRRRRAGDHRPLDGIPFAVKDVIATADLPTEGGTRLLHGFRPRRDADVVLQACRAGAVLVGKHVTHELAMGQDLPPSRNAWRPDHYPGGSSAGGGASVAVGSALFALGTDAGGSVRKPAALNGVVGLKPTYGRLSMRGVLPLASADSLDHIGIITRTAHDAGLLLDLLEGPGARHGAPAASAASAASADRVPHRLDGVRIGVERAYFGTAEPEIDRLFTAAVGQLESLGAEIVDLAIPRIDETIAIEFTILLAEVGGKHVDLIRRRYEDYGVGTRRALQTGALMPAAWPAVAQAARGRLRRNVLGCFREARIDVLATPTVSRTSMPAQELDPSTDLAEYVRFTSPWNLTGQPAVTVPCGFTEDRLPAGLQLVALPWRDDRAIAVAEAFQATTGWHLAVPPGA